MRSAKYPHVLTQKPRCFPTVCDELLNQQYGDRNQTLLHIAVAAKRPEMVEFLLHYGVNLEKNCLLMFLLLEPMLV